MAQSTLKYRKSFTDINKIFFINSQNEKITVFSPHSKIIEEFRRIGLETANKTIEELISNVSFMLCEEYDCKLTKNESYTMKEFKETELYKICVVLLNHLKESAYYLYDFKIEEMPPTISGFYKGKLDREKLLLKEFIIE
jgi:hypothetical protein